ncbi:hypothetical protein SCHPADRAFT_433347 [Schizopora paradoxa]|uniref:DUF7223 domain-containing protein n=1 Tax=Schizopora paradoxa TaxID=27342 RepID=A0A0H2RKJ3_9AGAM|nr:hypothetical protein SCHPADRAFT_433347 [Schizopora paradoxa]
MKSITLLPLLSLLLYQAQAKNDWSKPCLSGSCSYDIARNSTSLGATISINGSSSAISDITPAAGWSILNCTTSTNSQTIQIVCTDESKGCNHLFQNGAEHTIVRLPEDCGAGPFARVAKHSVPANQSLPADVASKVTRRSDGTTPQVQLLQIDSNFDASASSGTTVGFSVIASTDPSVAGNSSSTPTPIPNSRRRMRDLHRRTDIHPLGDQYLHSKRFSNPTAFNDSKSGSQPITFSRSVELFNDTLSCAGNEHENEEITLKIDVEADVDLTASYTFEIAGTVLPPHVSQLTASATIDGTFEAQLSLDADLTGTLSTGEVPLVTVAIPGLSIVDILTIGPAFVLNGEAEATINLDADLTIGIQYQLNDLSFTVGTSSSSSPGFTPLDSPVQYSLTPSITADADLEVHLIPTLSFGVSAFKNSVSVFVDLDAGLEVNLNATVEGDLSGSTDGSASASESAEACIDISSPISFNVGATGDFFGIIDESLNVPIFEKTFDIYQKCIKQAASTTLAPGPSTPTPTPTPPPSTTGFLDFYCWRSASRSLLLPWWWASTDRPVLRCGRSGGASRRNILSRKSADRLGN